MLMTTAVAVLAVLAAKTAAAVAVVTATSSRSLSAVMRGISANAVARPFGEYQLSV
jgi:hypothetical protein